MTDLNAQRVNDTGLAPVYSAATATLDVECDDVIVHIKNGSGGSINATVETPGTVAGDLAVADRVVAIGAGADKFLGPFPNQAYKQASTGRAKITLSATATVTVAALTY